MEYLFTLGLMLAAFGGGVLFQAAVRAAVSDVEARLKALEAKLTLSEVKAEAFVKRIEKL